MGNCFGDNSIGEGAEGALPHGMKRLSSTIGGASVLHKLSGRSAFAWHFRDSQRLSEALRISSLVSNSKNRNSHKHPPSACGTSPQFQVLLDKRPLLMMYSRGMLLVNMVEGGGRHSLRSKSSICNSNLFLLGFYLATEATTIISWTCLVCSDKTSRTEGQHIIVAIDVREGSSFAVIWGGGNGVSKSGMKHIRSRTQMLIGTMFEVLVRPLASAQPQLKWPGMQRRPSFYLLDLPVSSLLTGSWRATEPEGGKKVVVLSGYAGSRLRQPPTRRSRSVPFGPEVSPDWEEPSTDQYQCRGKLVKNFQDHWSIRISQGKGMDQWLVHMKFPWN